MSFPSNPNDNDILERFGRRFRYKSSKGVWDIISSPIVAPTVEAAPTTSSVAQAVNLPMSGNEIGAMAYVQESNRLYVWNGSGWFEVALVNTNPSISGGIESTYAASVSGDPITITVTASDPEDVPLAWSYTVTSGSIEDTTITNVDNVFTVTPGATATSFNVTFTASDGVNTDTSTTTIAVALPWSFQGSNYGYISGGRKVNTFKNAIERFSFATNAQSVSVGTLTGDRFSSTGHSSSENGYNVGGQETSSFTNVTTIDKFSFASNGAAVDIGDVAVQRRRASGQSSPVNGYSTAGVTTNGAGIKSIDKISFASNTNGVNVGNTAYNHDGGTGLSSPDYAYNCTGYVAQSERFPYASETTAQSVGLLPNSEYRTLAAGQQNADYGYVSSGLGPAPAVSPSGASNRLRFPFASNANAVNVGGLYYQRYGHAGQSSTEHGYNSGADGQSGGTTSIERFSFASDATSVYNRDMASGSAQGGNETAGHQY